MLQRALGLFTAAALGLTVGHASAADLARKAPVYTAAPAPFSWTGFYLGINGGGAWGTVEKDLTALSFAQTTGFPIASYGLNGWTVGGTVGYNWQANPWLVLGIEGDFNWADINGTAPCAGFGGPFAFECKTEVNWTADITARVGFVVDRALIYVKGGAVWADTDYKASQACLGLCPPFVINASLNDTRFGGLFGAGIEYAFLPNWSAKIEYNYMDFGKETYHYAIPSPPAPPGAQATASINQQLHVVKAGVNYHFNWGKM